MRKEKKFMNFICSCYITQFNLTRYYNVFYQCFQGIPQFCNEDLRNIKTPILVNKLEELLHKTKYDHRETALLVKGFTKGFSLKYKGSYNRRDTAKNIPFTPGIGSKEEMWEKIMKEVKLGRYAGPFDEPPFPNFVQSPIGLVPKAGNQTRLIFHLSYSFPNGNKSINECTPAEFCSVKYHDLDHAIANSLSLLKEADHVMNSYNMRSLFYGKTDIKSAFRQVPLKSKVWPLFLMSAENPTTGQFVFFVDKCLPFGASISCSHFQRFSNALRYVVQVLEKVYHSIMNYLDDFLFAHYVRSVCNALMRSFINICGKIGLPLSQEKTEWAEPVMIFLGMLLNGKLHTIVIPEDKKHKALQMLQNFCCKKKATVKEIEQLTGTLNFLNRAVVPGRVFT